MVEKQLDLVPIVSHTEFCEKNCVICSNSGKQQVHFRSWFELGFPFFGRFGSGRGQKTNLILNGARVVPHTALLQGVLMSLEEGYCNMFYASFPYMKCEG